MSEIQDSPTSYWRIDTWFADLDPATLKKFKDYNDELTKFNKTLNLVAPKTVPMSDAIHFADSIIASRVISKSNPKLAELYDLGSGNGFPGIIIAILNPGIKVRLVEMDQRKCEFMQHIVNVVGATNAEVLNCKIEDLKENSVQFAVTRGVASISKIIFAARKMFPKGGILYHLKGEQWGMEVSEIPIQLCSLWTPGLVGEYKLPVGQMKFAVVKTDKIG